MSSVSSTTAVGAEILTVRELIIEAFRTARIKSGVGVPTAGEITKGFRLLNGIIDQANLDKLLGSFFTTEIAVPLRANQLSYTIGRENADIDADRPVEVLSGYSRRNGLDYPMRISHAKEDYDRIVNKNLPISGWELFCYYQASYPNGMLYFYANPQDGLTTAYLNVSFQLAPYTRLKDEVIVPPLYATWMEYKLAKRLAAAFSLPFADDNDQILQEVEATLKRNNIKPFPQATSDAAGLGQSRKGNTYNVFTDR